MECVRGLFRDEMESEGFNFWRRTSWYLGHLAFLYIYLSVDTENAECAYRNIKVKLVRFLQLYFS